MVKMGHTFLCPHKLRMSLALSAGFLEVLEMSLWPFLSLFVHGCQIPPAPCSGFSFYRGLGALKEFPGLCMDPKGGK